ncbi:hypothetical protein CERZMDRAFT_101606 [Cercospora zeae-maydis SCOH1-5]|uniref:Uncharacterized protein n=1 Tax=Cercospora zeae-maydis SCOH1-5 TaxID=717836 RepID=A0A6A6F2X2_9PEZI|nr:hypothetical protein CERZMDRAFT_101606 [Cercospora zeae-maydis SCOH1-5]
MPKAAGSPGLQRPFQQVVPQTGAGALARVDELEAELMAEIDGTSALRKKIVGLQSDMSSLREKVNGLERQEQQSKRSAEAAEARIKELDETVQAVTAKLENRGSHGR